MSVLNRQGDVQAERSVEISDLDEEFLDTARNMETLRQWASLSGGAAVRWEECRPVGSLIDALEAALNRPGRAVAHRVPMGINGWVLGVLLTCLCAEWLLRKRWGLT
jgi:hypothetical protein